MATDRPSDVEIRRALAECMTLGDIDDAMGWPPGTARRRRWRPLERGGLPSADAELGGITLWFRSTFERWQGSRVTRGSRDRASGTAPAAPQVPALELPVLPQPPEGTPTDPQPVGAGATVRSAELTDDAARSRVEEPGEREDAMPTEIADSASRPDDRLAAAEMEAPALSEVGADGDSEDTAGEEHGDEGEVLDQSELGSDEPATDEDPAAVVSGFALAPGQRVLADVHGQWREAWVGHRDRGTVVVDYNLDGTPLGARQLRISVSRVRIPDDS